MWRSWQYDPPNIPFTPVIVSHLDLPGIEVIGTSGYSNGENYEGVIWRPTGIFREEYWAVTGRWV